MCWQSKRFYWERAPPAGEQLGKGTQKDCPAGWLTASGFMVMGLVSGLSLVNHSDSESFLVAHTLFSQDGCQREGFWEVVRIHLWPFLNSSGWWWLISSMFLTRTSCCKTTHENGYYGAWPGPAVSVHGLPLTPRSRVLGLLTSRPQMQSTKPKSSPELTEPQGNHWQTPITILPGQAPEPILGKSTHPSMHPTVP